jgi:hypothetical protein
MATLFEGGFISEGRFVLTNVLGSGRFALEGAPPGWWLKSVTIAGVDVTDAPITFGRENRSDVMVTIGTRGGAITGRLLPVTREEPGRASAAVFPVDSARWFYRSRYLRLARAAPDGRFSAAGLPPGDYWVAPVATAVEEKAYTAWQHADFLSGLLSSASRVHVAEGQSTTIPRQLGWPVP